MRGGGWFWTGKSSRGAELTNSRVQGYFLSADVIGGGLDWTVQNSLSAFKPSLRDGAILVRR